MSKRSVHFQWQLQRSPDIDRAGLSLTAKDRGPGPPGRHACQAEVQLFLPRTGHRMLPPAAAASRRAEYPGQRRMLRSKPWGQSAPNGGYRTLAADQPVAECDDPLRPPRFLSNESEQ